MKVAQLQQRTGAKVSDEAKSPTVKEPEIVDATEKPTISERVEERCAHPSFLLTRGQLQ